jgi:hypothetical protein
MNAVFTDSYVARSRLNCTGIKHELLVHCSISAIADCGIIKELTVVCIYVSQNVCVCMCVCVFVCVCMYVCVYVCMYVCMCVCVCMYVCMRV